MAVIVVYGGGFQPFHVGHLSSYLQAKKAFPEAAFYIAASNDTKTRPIPFNDKQFLAQQAGVVDPFVEVKLPIRPHEILDKYNPEKDIFVLIRSERDPVGYTKKDGSPGYYQPFENLESCAPFATHGYVFVTKKQVFKLNGQEVYSGTQVRDMYSNSDDQGKIKIISQLYPKSKQQKMIKKLLDKYLSNTQPMDLPKPNAIKKLKQKQLAETISKIRPLLKEASIEKKLKFLKLMKSALTESSLNEAPAGGYRLVRVVDGLDNIKANGDGSLTAIARYNGHSQRNTLHFTVNSMVGDHNMGKFPGKYVIIANPAEMPRDQAAGARAEDTWYRFNNEGEINLGRAIVLAPEGSSVPNGIKAEYYKGDRSTAIDTAFKQMNVGFHGVAGTDAVIGIKNDEYHKDFSTQYGTGATQGGQHDGSLEGYLESIPARLQGYLGHLQKSIYYEPPGERETFVTSYANEIISIYRDQITKWAKANPQEFRVSATYFNYIIKIMDAYQAIFTRAEQAYNQQYQDYLAAEKQWKASNRPPAPGQPPPLDPAPPPKMATWPPQGLDLSVPNIQLSYAKKNPQGMEESRIIDPQMVDVYYRPIKDSRGKRIIAKNIPMSTVEILLKRIIEKYNVPIESFEYTPSNPVNEISDTTLQSYLGKADRQISNRLDRMSQARERLNKNYEIYDVNNPTKIIDKFEANTPELAREYYNKFIKEYNPGDQDFHFEVRRSTGLSEEGVAEGGKKKKKKSSRSMGGYFFPGYAYFGGGDSGEGGGDGGGESKNSSMAEGTGQQLNIQQLATVSDEALDNAYHYGRSTPGHSFGWQANLKSAAYAKHMIDKGVTDIEAISDAIHKGWNVTAQAFVQNPAQFSDTEKLKAAGKLEAKLQQKTE